MEDLPEMNVNEIALKLQGDWADWDDKPGSCTFVSVS